MTVATLKEIEPGVDVVLFGQIVAREDAGNGHGDTADSKRVTDSQTASSRDGRTDYRGILVLFKISPSSSEEFEGADLLHLVAWQSVEHHNIEACPAVVGEDLDGNDILHAFD